MWDVIGELVESGTTLLLTTQYLEEADRLADSIAVVDHGRVIAEGTPRELKASVRGEHLDITLAAGADVEAAVTAVKPYATGDVQPDGEAGRLVVPVQVSDGLTTDVVRSLDAAGVRVTDVTTRRASLDDVFFTLTGHAAETANDAAAESTERSAA